jgi:RNA polymerase sigma factor (sigma-70 family)
MDEMVLIGAPADADLVLAAQHGDVGALGLLLARHKPTMRAVALSILGYGPEAEDAVQDAALVALRRVADIRDPHAVVPWLHAIVRNACRMYLRSRIPVPVSDIASVLPPAVERDPAALLDTHGMRDWVWCAIEELSPALRLVTILRYFTDVTAYDQMAEVCGVPIGTVRSRLNQARTKLHEALLRTADLAHDDVATLTRSHRRDAQEMLDAAERGTFGAALTANWDAALEITWPQGKHTNGLDYLMGVMDRDYNDGVRQVLTNVVASREVVIWETNLISPPDDPFHCPPALAWVQFLDDGRVSRLRMFHAPRTEPPASASRETTTPLNRTFDPTRASCMGETRRWAGCTQSED